MFIEVLLALQAVPADRHPVVRGVEDPRVVEFTHGGEFVEHTADLAVDVFTAGVLAAALIADRPLVAVRPHPAHVDLVADIHVAIVEGLQRQPVGWQRRLPRVGRGERRLVGVVRGAVLREQFRRAVPRVVRMGKAEVHQEWIDVLAALALLQIGHHLVAVPGTAAFRGASALGRIATDGKQRIGRLVGVALFARAHRVVAGGLEHRRHREPLEPGRTVRHRTGGRCIALFSLRRARPDRQVPHRAAAHHHVPARRADRARKRAHVVGGIEHHSLGGKPLDRWRVERRGRIIESEIERRLVVHNDEENVGPASRRARARRGNRYETAQAHKCRTEAVSHEKILRSPGLRQHVE